MTLVDIPSSIKPFVVLQIQVIRTNFKLTKYILDNPSITESTKTYLDVYSIMNINEANNIIKHILSSLKSILLAKNDITRRYIVIPEQ